MAVTKNLADVIRRKLAADPDLAAAVDRERFNANVGAVIYEARTLAGLTQQQLADRVGMHQSAIARLEDADYDGHSLRTLERIAGALGKRIEIAFAEPSVTKEVVLIETLPPPEWASEVEATWEPHFTTTSSCLAPSARSLVAS